MRFAILLLLAAGCAAPPGKTWADRFQYPGGAFVAKVTPDPKLTEGSFAVSRVEFPSPVTTEHAANDNVISWYYEPPVPTTAAVIILPGWKSGFFIERGLARHLALEGFKVLLLALPYQAGRTPAGFMPDDLLLSGDIDRTENAMIQAVLDTQRAAEWLRRERGVTKIGLFGLSLGGFLGSVVHSSTTLSSATVLALCGGNIAEVMWCGSWLLADIKKDLVRQGYTIDTLRERVRRMDPLTYATPAKREGLRIIASSDDEIVPKDTAKALIQAFGKPDVTWIGGDHISAARELDFEEITTHFQKRLKP